MMSDREEDYLRKRIAKLESQLAEADREVGYWMAEAVGPKKALEIIEERAKAKRVA